MEHFGYDMAVQRRGAVQQGALHPGGGRGPGPVRLGPHRADGARPGPDIRPARLARAQEQGARGLGRARENIQNLDEEVQVLLVDEAGRERQ